MTAILFIFFGLIGIIIVIVLGWLRKVSTRKKIDRIRKSWGKPKTESFDFYQIRKYSQADPDISFHRLSEQTISDLNLCDLFACIDRTTSKVGQQYLFNKITTPSDQTADQAEKLIHHFSTDEELRTEVQFDLLKLGGYGAYFISSLLGGGFLERPKWFFLLFVDLAIVMLLLILSFAFPVFVLPLIVLFSFNVLLHYGNKSNVAQFAWSFPQLGNLMDTSKQLMRRGGLFYEKSVSDSLSNLVSFQNRVRLIQLHGHDSFPSEIVQLGSYFSELIKAVFLIEVLALYWITKSLEQRTASIRTLFNYVGAIDCALSVASLRAGAIKTCIPTLTSGAKSLHAKGIFHPLIEACVKNDLTVHGKGVLITGSNMSGKSTFLRTLTINSILAQTIHTCFADEFISPILKQFTSIQMTDSLSDGRSLYFQEVALMASWMDEAAQPGQSLFVLDEVFKGTNTIERIAAAKAVLSYLNQHQNLVVVSTHDLELAHLLGNEFDVYHFAEHVDNQELFFDHTLKPGPVQTQNAIQILELFRFPPKVISEARMLATDLIKTRNGNDRQNSAAGFTA